MKTLLIASENGESDLPGIRSVITQQDQILFASSILDTIQIMNTNEIDLIVISLSLTNPDPLGAIAGIRQKNVRIPVILVTDYLTLSTLRLAAEAGTSEVIQTPVDQDNLTRLLSKYLH